MRNVSTRLARHLVAAASAYTTATDPTSIIDRVLASPSSSTTGASISSSTSESTWASLVPPSLSAGVDSPGLTTIPSAASVSTFPPAELAVATRPLYYGSGGSSSGPLRASPVRLPWWNYTTEFRQKWMLMYGGNKSRNTFNARHRVYVKKFKRNGFPNRTRQHWAVAQTGVTRQRPRRMPWPYDISSMIFNQASPGSDKIGYVVGNKMLKTAVVASRYLVYYPKFNQRVARVGRYFAHDEDMACVEGDLVHIKMCRKLSKYKHYYIFSILEPNIEARERLKLGLPAVPPPLFGYPTNRRIIKLNLASAAGTKQKTAAAIQEHVQDVYRYAGRTGDSPKTLTGEASFEDAHRMIAPNARAGGSESLTGGGGVEGQIEGFDEVEHDNRTKRGEEYYSRRQPDGGAPMSSP